MTDTQKKAIIDFTKDYYGNRCKSYYENEYILERYLDYRDEFPMETIKKIIDSEHPYDTYSEIVDDWDIDCNDWYYEDEFFEELEDFCEKGDIDESDAKDIVYDFFHWQYPEDFLNPSFGAEFRIEGDDVPNTLYDWCDEDSDNYKNSSLYTLANFFGKAEELREFCLSRNDIDEDDQIDFDSICDELYDMNIDKFVKSAYISMADRFENSYYNEEGCPLFFYQGIDLYDAMDILEKKTSITLSTYSDFYFFDDDVACEDYTIKLPNNITKDFDFPMSCISRIYVAENND